ncbi:hypothetical protein PG987_010899 [Apiospora arundinis]
MCIHGVSFWYARGLDIIFTAVLGGLRRMLGLCGFRRVCNGRCVRYFLIEILDGDLLLRRCLFSRGIVRGSNFTLVSVLLLLDGMSR